MQATFREKKIAVLWMGTRVRSEGQGTHHGHVLALERRREPRGTRVLAKQPRSGCVRHEDLSATPWTAGVERMSARSGATRVCHHI